MGARPDRQVDWREPMKALVSAITAASVTLLGAEVAHAGAPHHLFNIPLMYWILLIVVLLMLNLLCCWLKK
jgi:hypothetical protein